MEDVGSSCVCSVNTKKLSSRVAHVLNCMHFGICSVCLFGCVYAHMQGRAGGGNLKDVFVSFRMFDACTSNLWMCNALLGCATHVETLRICTVALRISN